MPRPLFSIIMPSYNHGKYISQAIKSVVNQTFGQWELIIVDNHSTDQSMEIIKTYSDSRIRFELVHNNGSIAYSRNVGFGLSSGSHICFLDSDDWWEPIKLETIHQFIKEEDPDLLFHEENWCFSKNLILPKKLGSDSLLVTFEHLLIKGNCISTSACTVKRKILDSVSGFPECRSLNTAEDYALWMRIAYRTSKLKSVPKILGNYRVHDSNNIHKSQVHCQAILQAKKEALLYSSLKINKFTRTVMIVRTFSGAIKMALVRGKAVTAFKMVLTCLAKVYQGL